MRFLRWIVMVGAAVLGATGCGRHEAPADVASKDVAATKHVAAPKGPQPVRNEAWIEKLPVILQLEVPPIPPGIEGPSPPLPSPT